MDFKIYNMKKLLFILFTFSMIQGIYGQGNNLQFNQVVNQDFTAYGTGQNWYNAGTITVGANKVLKITSYMGFRGSSTINYIKAKIDNKLIYAVDNSNDVLSADSPIWLSSGTHTIYLTGWSNQFMDLNFSISGVEFNIVQ